jgi:hypothetical protein
VSVVPKVAEFLDENTYHSVDSVTVMFRPFTPYDGILVTSDTDAVITFGNCSDLIDNYVVNWSEEVTDLIERSLPSISDICLKTQAYCVGELLQFQSVEDCLAFLAPLPLRTCNTPRFSGDGLNCRALHAIMLSLDPAVHCPHVGPNSTPCNDRNCKSFFPQYETGSPASSLRPFHFFN